MGGVAGAIFVALFTLGIYTEVLQRWLGQGARLHYDADDSGRGDELERIDVEAADHRKVIARDRGERRSMRAHVEQRLDAEFRQDFVGGALTPLGERAADAVDHGLLDRKSVV